MDTLARNQVHGTATASSSESAVFYEKSETNLSHLVAARCGPRLHGVQGVPSSNLGAPTSLSGLSPTQAREAGIVSVGRDPFAPGFDGECGEPGVLDKIA